MMSKFVVKSLSSSLSNRLMPTLNQAKYKYAIMPTCPQLIFNNNYCTGKWPEFPSKKRPKSQLTDAQKLPFPPSLSDKRTFKIDQYGLPTLQPKDYERRVEFSTRVLERMNEDKSFLPSIVFSDEGNFRLFKVPGASKKDKNNQQFHESPQLPVIAWCGMTSRHIIGPFFFNSYVTESSYLRMIKTFLMPKLKELGYSLDKTWFQQDGAPPHRSTKDLTPLDYFLWDYLKSKLETNYRPTNTADMKESITLELENIDEDLLEKVVFNLRDRLQACIQAGGTRFDSSKLVH